MIFMIVYMKVTDDKYELPVVLADTVKELATKCDVSINSIYSNIWRFAHGEFLHSQYVKVDIGEDEED